LEVTDFTATARGTVPMSGGGTTNFLRADGNWVAVLTQTVADTLYVNVDGDTMTGALNGTGLTMTGRINAGTGGTDSMPLRLFGTSTDGPRISFDSDTAVNRASIGPDATNRLVITTAGPEIAIQGGSTGVTIDGNGKRSGLFRDGILWIGDDTNAAVNSASPLRLYGTSGGDYISLYHGAAPQTRSGYIGFPGASELRVINEIASGVTTLMSNSGDVRFVANGTENGRFSGAWFLLNKTANDQAATGFQIVSSDGCNACITNNVTNTPMLALNKVGAGVGSGHDFAHWRNNGTTIGSITRNGTTAAVLYNTSSDYRLKNDHGGIWDGLQRLMRLMPRRIVWKDDPNQIEMDGFFAHEVAEAVPDAVTGEKDAVYESGDIQPQQLDASRLIPLIVAAVQDLARRVEGAT
ncbi:MAG TPA: hypothetical protein VH482_14895, partial [Thermomicrobiales bacterium]